MKTILKLEALGLFILFALIYFKMYVGTWSFFLCLFFIPDVSFLLYLISKKLGAIAYNVFHHQGFLVGLFLLGFFLNDNNLIKVSLIFLAHSAFDRVAGYGLKYFDSFDHTHLGWIGKSKHLNEK
ncbi:MAG: DUF4260 domain-containing protein [Bacteroidota bacterium]